LAVLWQVGELDAIVDVHSVDTIRNSFDDCLEKHSGRSHVCLFDEFDDSILRGAIK